MINYSNHCWHDNNGVTNQYQKCWWYMQSLFHNEWQRLMSKVRLTCEIRLTISCSFLIRQSQISAQIREHVTCLHHLEADGEGSRHFQNAFAQKGVVPDKMLGLSWGTLGRRIFFWPLGDPTCHRSHWCCDGLHFCAAWGTQYMVATETYLRRSIP